MLNPGDVVDNKYVVVRLIGEGGMGVVYEGRNIRLNRRVAIKVMHSRLSMDRDLVARFEREAQAAARIGSTHIADVIDIGDLPRGDRFMVMEYLDGESLAERLKARVRMSATEIGMVALQLLEGLTKVHQAGIIHRDLKPANIYLVRMESGPDFVKILDFGCCKMAARGEAGDVKSGIGTLFGTLTYMAPEQFESGSSEIDFRVDLYAVGVMLYRAVTGQPPYRASNLFEMIQKLRERGAAPLRELAPEVDAGFARIVERAIEWDAAARFSSALEMRDALMAWLKTATRVDELLNEFLDAGPATGNAPQPAPSGTALAAIALKSRAPAPAAPAREQKAARERPYTGEQSQSHSGKVVMSKSQSGKQLARRTEMKPQPPPTDDSDLDEPTQRHKAESAYQSEGERTIHKKAPVKVPAKIPAKAAAKVALARPGTKPMKVQGKKQAQKRPRDEEPSIEVEVDMGEMRAMDDLSIELDDGIHTIRRLDKK